MVANGIASESEYDERCEGDMSVTAETAVVESDSRRMLEFGARVAARATARATPAYSDLTDWGICWCHLPLNKFTSTQGWGTPSATAFVARRRSKMTIPKPSAEASVTMTRAGYGSGERDALTANSAGRGRDIPGVQRARDRAADTARSPKAPRPGGAEANAERRSRRKGRIGLQIVENQVNLPTTLERRS